MSRTSCGVATKHDDGSIPNSVEPLAIFALLAQWQCLCLPSTSCRFDSGAGLMKQRTKRHRECRCRPQSQPGQAGTVTKTCYWGNCIEWRCPTCNGNLGGFGEIWCPCDGGCYRAFRHPGMENQHYTWSEETGRVYQHTAVKSSKAHRFQGGKHNNARR